MSRSHAHLTSLSLPGLVALLAIAAGACSDSVPAPTAADILLAKPGTGGGGSGGSGVTVSAASPDSASQGTTLDVVISGSGFTSDMVATWELAGTSDPSQVRTNNTRYVNQKQLVANITIGPDAVVAKWDIRVASGGKGGIGMEMFEVQLADPAVLSEFEETVDVAQPGAAPNMQPAGITGDGRDEFGRISSVSRYQGAFCGVESRVFMSNAGGDLIVYPDKNYNTGMQPACGSRRALWIHLSYQPGGARGAATSFGALHNARGAGHLSPGQSSEQAMGFGGLTVKGCERVNFNPAQHPSASPGRVTRLADAAPGVRRWRVESVYPHMAVCMETKRGSLQPTNTVKYLPFAYTATEVPFPYPSYP